MSMQTFVSCRW